jgi:hypothetical protein|tara:strand:+ start:471 stop:638 length:168 start_codon:yes stop_codon:yes gene_type:complete
MLVVAVVVFHQVLKVVQPVDLEELVVVEMLVMVVMVSQEQLILVVEVVDLEELLV